jgi:transposase
MNAYSKDLRLKTLAAIDRGIPRKEVADLFGVCLSTIKRWLNRRRLRRAAPSSIRPGALTPDTPPRSRPPEHGWPEGSAEEIDKVLLKTC